ncbi:MAG: hypothetical protein EZS28_030330 [Streblomastix strix]|uniref:Uncharacterized protein n=1 Tax=Streblomastix strix TaxID=222440 RepID=A0A5J4UV24_9EUKA|nr:MAG: hypothetical protein EZS28_030330 [Streblomastix strix]
MTPTVCCSAGGEQLKAQVIMHAKDFPQKFQRLNVEQSFTVSNDYGWQTQKTFEACMIDYILLEIQMDLEEFCKLTFTSSFGHL